MRMTIRTRIRRMRLRRRTRLRMTRKMRLSMRRLRRTRLRMKMRRRMKTSVLRIPHLVEAAAVADALAELLHLGQLVGHALLLVELLGQRLQLSERQLQRQPVGVAAGCVLQHVLGTETPGAPSAAARERLRSLRQRVLQDDPRLDPKLQPGCEFQSVSLCCCQNGASPEPSPEPLRTFSRTSPCPSPEPPRTFSRTFQTFSRTSPILL